jgi:hypothetical protein
MREKVKALKLKKDDSIEACSIAIPGKLSYEAGETERMCGALGFYSLQIII